MLKVTKFLTWLFSASSGAAAGGCSVTAEEVNDLESRVQAALQQFLNTNLIEETEEEDLKAEDKEKDTKEDTKEDCHSSLGKEKPPSNNVEDPVKDKKHDSRDKSDKNQS